MAFSKRLVATRCIGRGGSVFPSPSFLSFLLFFFFLVLLHFSPPPPPSIWGKLLRRGKSVGQRPVSRCSSACRLPGTTLRSPSDSRADRSTSRRQPSLSTRLAPRWSAPAGHCLQQPSCSLYQLASWQLRHGRSRNAWRTLSKLSSWLLASGTRGGSKSRARGSRHDMYLHFADRPVVRRHGPLCPRNEVTSILSWNMYRTEENNFVPANGCT